MGFSISQKLTVAFGGLAAALYATETVVFAAGPITGRRVMMGVVGLFGFVTATAATFSLAAQAGSQTAEEGEGDGLDDAATESVMDDDRNTVEKVGSGADGSAAAKKRKPKTKQAVSAGFFDRARNKKEKTPQASYFSLYVPGVWPMAHV